MLNPGIGLLETPYNFFIDHLAPLCSFLKWPILSSNPQTKLLYHSTYPEVEIQLKNWSLNTLMESYNSILYSFNPEPTFKSLIEQVRTQNPHHTLWQKELKLIYHFHGCSDKGFHSTWIDPKGHFKELDLVFIYGKRMKELLQAKGLYDLPAQVIETGNYRKAYYEKHTSFFDEKVERDIFWRFKRKAPLLLYAPTWEDQEQSSSFFSLPESVFERLSRDFNILIKLHPNQTLKRPGYDPGLTLKKIKKLSSIHHVLVLPFYPLVYPILKKADLFLGDFSSVGYDALSYPKPLVFLNALDRSLDDPGALLFQAGKVISKNEFEQADSIIKKEFDRRTFFSIDQQKKLYNYAFSDDSLNLFEKISSKKEKYFFS